jgi:hypothetical protein
MVTESNCDMELRAYRKYSTPLEQEAQASWSIPSAYDEGWSEINKPTGKQIKSNSVIESL